MDEDEVAAENSAQAVKKDCSLQGDLVIDEAVFVHTESISIQRKHYNTLIRPTTILTEAERPW